MVLPFVLATCEALRLRTRGRVLRLVKAKRSRKAPDPRHGPIKRAARKYRPPSDPAYQDLVQAGWVAVLEAGHGPEAPPSHVYRTAKAAAWSWVRSEKRARNRDREIKFLDWAEGTDGLELTGRQAAAAWVLASLMFRVTEAQRAAIMRTLEGKGTESDSRAIRRLSKKLSGSGDRRPTTG